MRQYRPTLGPDGCAICRHYAAVDEKAGECRIGRPRIGDETRVGIWPLVEATAFCGEYERRYEVAKVG